MKTAATYRAAAQPAKARPQAREASPRDFWSIGARRRSADEKEFRRALHLIVDRVIEGPDLALFHAVEAGVPTYMVDVIAGATGGAASEVMDLIGVSQTTYRRKDEASEPLPDVAGHRVMGYLRVVATLRRMLEESGDPEVLEDFDLEAWIARWIREPLPELDNKTPAEMLRNPEGQRAIEVVLERMRGGVPA